MTEQVKQQTQQAVQETQHVAGQVTDQAKSMVATQKARATESLSAIAQALRQTGQNLHEHDQGAVGQLADQAATQVERVSGYLQERDMTQLQTEAEEYTRRKPALVLGGAFALGVLAARFLKTSGAGHGSHGYTPNPASGAGARQGTYRYQTAPYRSEVVQTGEPEVRSSDGA